MRHRGGSKKHAGVFHIRHSDGGDAGSRTQTPRRALPFRAGCRWAVTRLTSPHWSAGWPSKPLTRDLQSRRSSTLRSGAWCAPWDLNPDARRPQFLRLLRKPFRQGRITWWAWRDSNSHVRRRQFLRLVCMQFHHRPMALRGRFERPIVGLEATRVTIRIRSTLAGRAGFEPARFSRKVTGATAQRLRPTHPSPRCQRTYTNIWLGGRPARRTPTCRAHWSANQPGLPISHAFRAGNYQYNNDESG